MIRGPGFAGPHDGPSLPAPGPFIAAPATET